MKHLLSFLILIAALSVQAQDTLTVVQYNLLNYGNITGFCSASVNSVDAKDNYLIRITDYLEPDIFSVNEMGKSVEFHDRILNNVFNRDGLTRYARISVPNIANSEIVNMIYYNTDKVRFHSLAVAQSVTRDIDVVKFYYNSSSLSQGDTVFLHCIVAHLKAGEGSSNVLARTTMVLNTMNFLQSGYQPGNFLVMGDFNLYSPTEGAFIALTQAYAPTWVFNDPADRVGEWHSNSSFSDVHTQSTHTTGGCAASGGMDDRFDFILASTAVMEGTHCMKYVPGTYMALGQDGNHYNKALTDAPALSLENELVQALYSNSDHLPVVMKLEVDESMAVPESTAIESLHVVNPADDQVKMMCRLVRQSVLDVKLYNMMGALVTTHRFDVPSGSSVLSLSVGQLPQGIYLISLTEENGHKLTRKVFVK
ncbi:MAG TPA: hypothetical protein DCR43_00890 [Bacteroidales bacterium]|nr:MAG: hypothetical protein A2X11_14715 [Bacteroidetes bacterium GWE2_42_24]OFY31602.1 MAG: hypothetical protein A2X09_08455 [Bacteroidetes bacterium GWF2_43_11]HAQ64408.1 hypothetical protein [Bacteroidales bacterium]HBZ67142.1 hypothetical protein [Bacteroidales bacterium]